MSLHPSLKIDKASSTQRTVMSRIERIKDLMKKNLWSETRSVTGLPKTKILKVKSRKVKTKEEAAEGGAAAVPGVATAAKPTAGDAKTAVAKPAAGTAKAAAPAAKAASAPKAQK
jgi:small basic protein (TIGR04137 family)